MDNYHVSGTFDKESFKQLVDYISSEEYDKKIMDQKINGLNCAVHGSVIKKVVDICDESCPILYGMKNEKIFEKSQYMVTYAMYDEICYCSSMLNKSE